MKNIKKILCLMMALVLTFSLLTACGSKDAGTPDAGTDSNTNTDNNAANGEKVEIKFLHKWPQPENMPYFEAVVKEFEAANPNIKVNMEAVADEPIKDKLRILVGTNDRPDIFFSWSGEFANKFIRANGVYDLTEALDADGGAWRNSIMEAGLEPFSAEGKNYGIPLRINGKFFVYNKEIFDKYNLTAPKTWDEFMQVNETLKQNGVTPIAFGNQSPWAGCHYLTGLNQKFVDHDVRIKDYMYKTGEFTDPGYLEALKYYKELNDKGYFQEYSNSTTHDMANQTFAKGDQAMIYVELEEFKSVQENMNGTAWDFFPMPAIEGAAGNQNVLVGAPDGFLVSSTTKHPEEAIKFLKFITSKEMGEKLVADLQWPSPVIGAVNESNSPEFLVKGMKAIEEAEGMALWLDTDIHIKVSDVYLPGLQELVNGTMTPEQLIADVQKTAKEVQSLEE